VRLFTPSENNRSEVWRQRTTGTFIVNRASMSDALTGQLVSKLSINCLAVLIRVVPLTEASLPSHRQFFKP
jgi:hypothetical protein